MPRDSSLPEDPAERDLRRRIEQNHPSVTAAEYDAFVLARGRDEVACAVRDLLAGLRSQLPVGDLLEVAVGTGILTRRLAELHGLSKFGIDVRLDWLRYAVDKGRAQEFRVAQADFERMPFAPESFDACTGLAFLNHRTAPAAFYREAHRVLRPEGVLLLPWVKPKPGSVEREAAAMAKERFEVMHKDTWYLLARKTA